MKYLGKGCIIIYTIISLTSITNASVQSIPNDKVDLLNKYITKNISVQCFDNGIEKGKSELTCSKSETSENGSCSINFQGDFSTIQDSSLDCKVQDKSTGHSSIQKLDISSFTQLSEENYFLTPIAVTKTKIPSDFVPSNLVSINLYSKKNNLSLVAESDDMKIKKDIIEDLDTLIKSCKTDNNSITISDGYRSHSTQKQLFEELGGWAKGVAGAGYSEHQIGFTVDLKTNASTYNCLHSNMYKSGFILSYPEGNKYLNGYSVYEPWHFRYIGKEATNIIFNEGMQNKPLEFLTNYKKHKKDFKNTIIIDRTDSFKRKTLQTKTYSCEISSTSDILTNILGKNITEDELIKQIDKSKFGEGASYQNDVWIWGNPNAGFVGNIDTDKNGRTASQRNLTGYGVYEKPIAKLYHKYNLNTKVINNTNYTSSYALKQHLTEILTEFEKGNYVQLWIDICTTPAFDDGELPLSKITQEDVNNGKNAKNACWSYGQDRKIEWYYQEKDNLVKERGLIGEHNGYLLGFTGTAGNPKTIIIWDTSTGRHQYPIQEFLRKWEEMDYRSIVIYNK